MLFGYGFFGRSHKTAQMTAVPLGTLLYQARLEREFVEAVRAQVEAEMKEEEQEAEDVDDEEFFLANDNNFKVNAPVASIPAENLVKAPILQTDTAADVIKLVEVGKARALDRALQTETTPLAEVEVQTDLIQSYGVETAEIAVQTDPVEIIGKGSTVKIHIQTVTSQIHEGNLNTTFEPKSTEVAELITSVCSPIVSASAVSNSTLVITRAEKTTSIMSITSDLHSITPGIAESLTEKVENVEATTDHQDKLVLVPRVTRIPHLMKKTSIPTKSVKRTARHEDGPEKFSEWDPQVNSDKIQLLVKSVKTNVPGFHTAMRAQIRRLGTPMKAKGKADRKAVKISPRRVGKTPPDLLTIVEISKLWPKLRMNRIRLPTSAGGDDESANDVSIGSKLVPITFLCDPSAQDNCNTPKANKVLRHHSIASSPGNIHERDNSVDSTVISTTPSRCKAEKFLHVRETLASMRRMKAIKDKLSLKQ